MKILHNQMRWRFTVFVCSKHRLMYIMTRYLISERNGIMSLVEATELILYTPIIVGGVLNNIGDTSYSCSVPQSTIYKDKDSKHRSRLSADTLQLLDHLLVTEKLTSPLPIYMEDQAYMTTNYRSKLILWLMKLHFALKLAPGVSSLAVNILDRFLTKRNVEKKEMKVAGLACLLIASKVLGGTNYDEQNEILVQFQTGLYYTADDVIHTELVILTGLKYHVSVPTSYTFLYIYLEATGDLVHKDITQDASFIQECTLPVYDLLDYIPSKIASGSIFIARMVNGVTPWNEALAECTTYNKEAVVPIVKSILYNIIPHIECMLESEWIKGKFNRMNKSKISKMQELGLMIGKTVE